MSDRYSEHEVVKHIEAAFAITTAVNGKDYGTAITIIEESDRISLPIAFSRILHLVISSLGLSEDLSPDEAWALFSAWTMEAIAAHEASE